MKCLALSCVVIVTAGLGGCSAVAVDPHAGFPQVSQIVTERAGKEVAWTPGPEEMPPALEAIAARLKDGLSEDDAVQIALLNNRNLQALYARLGIAQTDLVQASLLHNPVVDAAAGFPVGGGLVDLSSGVAMDFIDLLYVPLRKRVATAKFEETKLRVAAEVLDLAWRIRPDQRGDRYAREKKRADRRPQRPCTRCKAPVQPERGRRDFLPPVFV